MAQEFDGRARAVAFSLLGTTFGLGLAFGPLIAGLLIEGLGWRAVFATATVVGVIALALATPVLAESRDPDAQGLDWAGVATFTAALSLFTLGIVEAPELGWLHPLVAVSLIASVIAGVAFIAVEKHNARPMLDLSLFRLPRFLGVQLLPIATGYAYVVLLILLPLRLIGIQHMSEVEAGLLMLALSGPMLAVPSAVATLTRWVPAGTLVGIGLLIAAGVLSGWASPLSTVRSN